MDYMEQALSLAKSALGQTSPNPAVGAVIVKGNMVVGQGYTQPPGAAHAEIMALNQAGYAARGGTMYVTLEPCCHYGRTPPCSQAIIAAGISEVRMAMLDPNPVVSGKGTTALEQAGIKTYLGERESEAREINASYIKFITTGIPFVTAKFAASLDGKIATRSGDARWISSPESRNYAHRLRYLNDAIMVGINTILTDNPRLTARHNGAKPEQQPARVIVDSRGRTPLTARVFSESGKTILALGDSLTAEVKEKFTQTGAELLELPLKEGRVDLKSLLEALGKQNITSLLVEGGGTLLGSLFDAKLVDKVVAFIAPIIIGGEAATTAVGGQGIDRLTDAFRLERVNVNRLGEDIVVSGYIKRQ